MPQPLEDSWATIYTGVSTSQFLQNLPFDKLRANENRRSAQAGTVKTAIGSGGTEVGERPRGIGRQRQLQCERKPSATADCSLFGKQPFPIVLRATNSVRAEPVLPVRAEPVEAHCCASNCAAQSVQHTLTTIPAQPTMIPVGLFIRNPSHNRKKQPQWQPTTWC